MRDFWHQLNKPITVLAPMADVTDAAFRHIIAKYGKPDVTWTEFVSADGLYHTREIQKLPDNENPLTLDLVYSEAERPIVAQLFTSKPDMMEYAAKVVTELGFDGIDINMGCPDRSVEKQGAGAALMKNPSLARSLIAAAKCGSKNKVPVSVKTRIGYNENTLSTWLPELLAEEPALITIHARTRKEMSDVPARWSHVKEAVAIRDALKSEALIFGNGDIHTIEEAKHAAKETGADGVMIGRGIFGNPWLWSELPWDTIPQAEKFAVLYEHCVAFEKLCPHKPFAVMRKHFKAYVHGFAGAGNLRAKLMSTNSAAEVSKILKSYKQLT